MHHAAELEALTGVRHGFTDRRGGVSRGALASLNLALRDGETEPSLVENWSRVTAVLGARADQIVLLDQVHEGTVVEATQPTGPLASLAPADGVVTRETGLVLVIRTADCVPVLFAGPGVIGAAHTGWRGVASDVVGNTVAALTGLGARPEDLVAVVGPHISVEAYEVGSEVVDGIVGAGVPEEVFVVQRARPHVDLRAAVTHQLEQAGVGTIGHVAHCTYGDPDFYSHRRDGPRTGRQAAVITRVP